MNSNTATNLMEVLPLTQGQLGIWFAQLLAPDDPFGNIGEYIEIRGPVDEHLFEQALRHVFASTDAMHLRFKETETGPVQYFNYDPNWTMVKKDFSSEPNAEQSALDWMLHDMDRPFQVDGGELFRCALLRLSDERFFWYEVNHHIINDGVGWRLFQRRVSEAYSALVERRTPAISDTSWRDIVAYETAYRGSEQFRRDRTYWLEQLAAPPPPVTLSGRQPKRARGFAKAVCRISHDLKLSVVAHRYSGGPAALITAAVAIYLHRMTGATDMLLGMPLAARVGAKSRSTVGVAANALPLRIKVERSACVGEIIGRTARGLRNALRHQQYRGEDLRRDLNLTPNHSDTFGTYVNFTPFTQGITFGGHPASNHPLGNWRVEDLQFVYYGGTDQAGQRLDVIGNPEHYTVEELAEHGRRLVHVIEQIADADVAVGDIELLTALERSAILHTWNDTTQPLPSATVIDLFNDQVRERSSAVALAADGRAWTYRELDDRANRLAQAISARGIGSGDRVALAVSRSMDMVAALIAILKTGAGYVPIDPDYPDAFTAYVLHDCRPALVVATKATSNLLAEDIPSLVLDDALVVQEIERFAAESPVHEPITPDHPAYVIYTSGSTGKPKGVIGLHRGMVNRLVWMAHTFPFHEAEPTLAKTSLSFVDGSTEILGPLTAGSSVVLADSAAARDPSALAALIETHGIGRITVVPSLLAALIDTTEPERLASCKLWITSGAALPTSLSQRFHALLPEARLLNLYGTSEASGDSLYAVCTPDDCPIGRPIWNTQIHVLNDQLELLPPGATGELYIAGIGLAAGYLDRADLTAERFIADPFGEPGGRMYKTGDLARRRADGIIEFRGRNDDQVKINGIRIELGEIEAAIRSFASVGNAAVIAREINEIGHQLVAFVSSVAGGTVFDEEALRTHLAQRLPEATLPSVIAVVETMPLLPNGKLDRRALVAQAATIAVSGDDGSAPLRTPTELTLAEIWSEVLRRPIHHRSADFFALGGDSLRAIQLITRARRLFGIELPLVSVFNGRTLGALARAIDLVSGQDGAGLPPPPIGRAPAGVPAPLSYSQQRMWTIQTLDPQNTAYNMAAAIRVSGALDITAMKQAIERVAERHDILRTTYSVMNGDVVQTVQPLSHDAVEIVNLTGADARGEALSIARRLASVPIDLSNGPITRCVLMRVAVDEHIALFIVHHIAGDQWSGGIIGREIAAYYDGFLRGQPVKLHEPNLRYRDYAFWQRDAAMAGDIARQLDFWRRTLDAVPPLEMPIDKPRPRMGTLNGSYVLSKVDPALFASLERLARREAATLFMTMLAGFAVVLSRLSGLVDIAIGVPVANRSHDTIEQVVGTFVNLLVLRIDLSGEPTFSELLSRVRNTALDAFAHQDVPFDRLVHELVKMRDTSRAPLTQVMFNIQNAPTHGINLQGLTLEPIALDRGGAQFELSVSVDRQIGETVTVEFNTDLFEKATIERFVERYFNVLKLAVAAPSTRLSEFDMLASDERRLLDAWNATAAEKPSQPFIAAFEARAFERPNAPAVTFGPQTISYGELNARANALARELANAGVDRGAMVGVCVERSFAMIVALLAVQKSGGAYVPLDPELPAARLAYMMTDSGAGVIVMSARTRDLVEAREGIICIDAEATAVPTAPPDRAIPFSDPAYVIYTSGSTGKPKGVAISHGALTNFLASMQREPGLTQSDVLAAVTTVSFDIAGLELYLPLQVGARIELVPSEIARDGFALSRLIAERQVSIMQATPATWRMLLDAGWEGSANFRALCGGEALPWELAEPICGRVGELWNLYGPTETTIWSTAGRVERDAGTVDIGRPIDNTQIYILKGLSPCPLGSVGEICIGGDGVAIGYLGRPDLTAERFVDDPFASRPGARMYRTGDLGRWGTDGRLHHLGRMDHQVKIRGFRVETGEIEAVLNEHPSVRQAIVVTREVVAGDVRLVAYIHHRGAEELTISDVRLYLRTRLPDYMIPAIAVPLEAVPLSPNGKIARDALPDPFGRASVLVGEYEAPREGLETAIAEAWCQLLKIERVGAEDNFFELGGDSLLALRFVASMEQETGTRVDPRSLFFQTLRQVASAVEERLPVKEDISS